MKDFELIAIQEHWLYRFETGKLVDFCEERGYSCQINCTDDNDPLTPLQRPRGKGGVALLWRKTMGQCVKVLVNDCSSRICAIQVGFSSGLITIINCYLPCRGNKDSETEFVGVVDEVREIIIKYKRSSDIILVGDMNASVFREPPLARDKYFKDVLAEVGLMLPTDYPEVHTYRHGQGKSIIDYILHSNTDIISAVKVLDEHCNTSPHMAVTAKMPQVQVFLVEKSVNSSIVNKVKWDKVDKDKYRQLVEDRLSDGSVFDIESDSIDLVAEDITDILVTSARQCQPKRTHKRSKMKRSNWGDTISKACNESKKAFYRWKVAGRPVNPEEQSYAEMKCKKRLLRRAQRQYAAKQRYTLYNELMTYSNTSAQGNSYAEKKLFYKLIEKQRQNGHQKLSSLFVDDRHLTSDSEIREGWVSYFKNIASPENVENHYDNEYTSYIELNKLLIKGQCVKEEELIQVPEELVGNVIKQSKNGKAADIRGLQSEHLKYGGDVVINCLTQLANRILNTCEIPALFKHGLITPIYKGNNKPLDNPSSYRRITVASNLGRVIEKVHLELSKDDILPNQNPLQRGFTSKTSPSNGSLLLTEAICESLDMKQKLNAIFVDATQAFDRVWHDSMLVKLHDAGLKGRKWLFLSNWYEELSSQVKWEGGISSPFTETLGVRQGGTWSPTAYKFFINPLLNTVSDRSIGYHIGSIYLGLVAVADDLLFLSNDHGERQLQATVQEEYAYKEHYNVSETKTKIMNINGKVGDNVNRECIFNGQPLGMASEYKHIGVTRQSNLKAANKKLVEERIQMARRTAYALMGAGFHGHNGLNPKVLTIMYNLYVLPRLLYGLETVTLLQKDIDNLNKFHKNILRQIQNLPERTAVPIIYGLVGQFPIEFELHRRQFSLFGNIVREDCIERELAARQLAVKDENSSSWFVMIKKNLYKYGLPDPFELLENPPTKYAWKDKVKETLVSFWKNYLENEAVKKTSLKYWNASKIDYNTCNQLWTNAGSDTVSVHKANIHAKLLSGSYILQVNRAKFNQFVVSSLCPLCEGGSEDITHFMLVCGRLQEARKPFIEKLQSLLTDHRGRQWWSQLNSSDKVQLILDNSKFMDIDNTVRSHIWGIARGLCFVLHSRRSAILNKCV